MFTNLSAQIAATLHVAGVRFTERQERNSKGQTTAEYVGIIIFVAVLVLAVITLAPGLKTKVKEILDAAFDKIKGGLGG